MQDLLSFRVRPPRVDHYSPSQPVAPVRQKTGAAVEPAECVQSPSLETLHPHALPEFA